jgi:hypothetical protein
MVVQPRWGKTLSGFFTEYPPVLVVLFGDQLLGFELIRGGGEMNGRGSWFSFSTISSGFDGDVLSFQLIGSPVDRRVERFEPRVTKNDVVTS